MVGILLLKSLSSFNLYYKFFEIFISAPNKIGSVKIFIKIWKVSHRAHKEHKGLKMNENELSEIIIECAIKGHKTLEPGLLKSVYKKILAYE